MWWMVDGYGMWRVCARVWWMGQDGMDNHIGDRLYGIIYAIAAANMIRKNDPPLATVDLHGIWWI